MQTRDPTAATSHPLADDYPLRQRSKITTHAQADQPADNIDRRPAASELPESLLADEIALTNHLSRTKSLQELIHKTQRLARHLKMDGFFHFELEFPASILDAIGVLPDTLLAGIKANAFQNYDLVLRHLLANPGQVPEPLFRSTVDNHVQSAPYEPPAFLRHKEFCEFLRRMQIFDIFYLPLSRPNARCPAIFCCWTFGDPANLQRQVHTHLESIKRLAAIFDQIGRRKYAGKFHPSRNWPIPPSVRSIVELYAAKDVSLSLVAQIRGVHDVTVNKQMMVAKRAFGTSTSTGVVLEMIRQGLISVDGIF